MSDMQAHRTQMRLQRLFEAANTAMQHGHWGDALPLIEDILRITPPNPGGQVNRAIALDHLGRTDAALDSLARALAIDPTYRMALLNRAVLLCRLERWHDALADFSHILRHDPHDADALMQRGGTWFQLGDNDAALVDLRAALTLRPDHVATLTNLGLVLQTAGDLQQALACCDRAIALASQEADAWLNRGVVLQQMRRLDEALACFNQVRTLRPDDANMDYNTGLVHLTQGDYAAGWQRHEARWRTANLRRAVRQFGRPEWRGETIVPGQTILLHAEQGLGDTLQFCRYIPLVVRRAEVVVEAPQSLCRLLSRLPGVRAVVPQGEALPQFDWHCPLLSLPLAFGTTLETIPADVPYLTADPADAQMWRERLQEIPGRKVGLVWAGRARSDNATLRAVDRRRSMPFSAFAPFAEVHGVSLVSLQKGPEAAQLRDAPTGLVVRDWTDALQDFADTAGLVAGLDLVITVDTAVAHLAGAMGKPVWVMNRFDACWRWLEGREDSPWYPTARLFRQTQPGDWASVVAAVVSALQQPGVPQA